MTNQVKIELRDNAETIITDFLGGMIDVNILLAVLQGIVSNTRPILEPTEYEKLDQFVRAHKASKVDMTSEDESRSDEAERAIAAADGSAPTDGAPADSGDTRAGTKVLIRVSHQGTIPVVRGETPIYNLAVTRKAGPAVIEGSAISGTYSYDPTNEMALLDFGTNLRFILSGPALEIFKP